MWRRSDLLHCAAMKDSKTKGMMALMAFISLLWLLQTMTWWHYSTFKEKEYFQQSLGHHWSTFEWCKPNQWWCHWLWWAWRCCWPQNQNMTMLGILPQHAPIFQPILKIFFLSEAQISYLIPRKITWMKNNIKFSKIHI